MGCGISVIKYVLFLVNIICALAGVALIVLGSLAFSNIKSLESSDNNGFKILCISIIVLGSVISIISFFGCCGAIRESHCMTMTYAVILLILLILEIAIIAFVFVTNTKGGELFDALWNERNKTGGQAAIDTIQQAIKCCGMYRPGDYVSRKLPLSCCQEGVEVCTYKIPEVYDIGCKDAWSLVWKEIISFVVKVLTVTAAFTGLSAVLGCSLQHSFEKKYAKLAQDN